MDYDYSPLKPVLASSEKEKTFVLFLIMNDKGHSCKNNLPSFLQLIGKFIQETKWMAEWILTIHYREPSAVLRERENSHF